jgi:hypothetical protein
MVRILYSPEVFVTVPVEVFSRTIVTKGRGRRVFESITLPVITVFPVVWG